MSRPKGSKNKPKIPCTPETNIVEGALLAMIDRYKPGGTFDLMKDTPDILEWALKIQAFCEKKGFSPSELIEKFEQLERDKLFATTQLGKIIANSDSITVNKDVFTTEILKEYEKETYEMVFAALNKVHTASETEKRIQDTPEFKKGQEKAKNEGETKPKELSPFLKSRQAAKNGQK